MSNTGFQNLFSIPIFTTFLDEKVIKSMEDLVTPRLNQLKFQVENYNDYYSNRIVESDEIQFLLKDLNGYVDNYSKKIEIKINPNKNRINYWVQDYKFNNFHQSHAHPNSSISGIYYVRANQYAGLLRFKSPNPYPYFWRTEESNSDFYDILPQRGLLVLFPSYLFHTVLPSKHKDIIRTSFVFNVVK